MNPKNFPARKLLRQIHAGRDMSQPYTDEERAKLEAARNVRTKKHRGSR
jgi:hypothetical protein